jgi:hypothetical protein
MNHTGSVGKLLDTLDRTPGSPNNNVVPSDTAFGSFLPPEIRKLQTSEGQGPSHATTRPMRAKLQLPL